VEVAVSVDVDWVTLRRTVGSFSQPRAAVRDTRKVDDVDYVYDDVSVRLLDAAYEDISQSIRCDWHH